MGWTSGAPRIVRIALPADASETSYTFAAPVSKCLVTCMPSGFDTAVEADIRVAWESAQTADGGRYIGIKAGASKSWDMGGPCTPPLRLRANTAVANAVAILEIWE